MAKQSDKKTKIDTLLSAPVTPDIMPVFRGGEDALIDYISQNLVYPRSSQEQGIEGRVSLRFVIDKDGTVKNVEIIKSVDPACDREAARVIKSMPKWIPGQKNGVNISAFYIIPILFRLNRDINTR